MISVLAAKTSSADVWLWLFPALFLVLGVLRLFRASLPSVVGWSVSLLYLAFLGLQGKKGTWLPLPFLSFALIAIGLVILVSLWEALDRSELAKDVHTGTLLAVSLFSAVAALAPFGTLKGSPLHTVLPQALFALGAAGTLLVTLLSWRFLAEPASEHPRLLQWLRQSHLWAAVFWTGLMLFYWLRGWSGNPQQTLRVILLLVVFVGLLQPWQRRVSTPEGSHERWGLSPVFLLWCWVEGLVTAMVLMVELFALG